MRSHSVQNARRKRRMPTSYSSQAFYAHPAGTKALTHRNPIAHPRVVNPRKTRVL